MQRAKAAVIKITCEIEFAKFNSRAHLGIILLTMWEERVLSTEKKKQKSRRVTLANRPAHQQDVLKEIFRKRRRRDAQRKKKKKKRE